MDAELFTEKYIEEICKSMLIIDCIKKYPYICEDSEQMQNDFNDLCKTLGEVMDELTAEQRDHVLEIHSLHINK